jgi:lysozyme family protein
VGHPPTFFERLLMILFANEGGWLSQEDAKRMGDPSWRQGGTMMGITQATLNTLDPGKRAEDVDAPYARAFYQGWYWEPVRELCTVSPPVAALVFDAGVQHGPAMAVKLLQRVVQSEDDGIMGPNTCRMVAAHGPVRTLLGFSHSRRALLVNWVLRDIDKREGVGRDEFLAGVVKRVDSMEALGFKLLEEDCAFMKYGELYRPSW